MSELNIIKKTSDFIRNSVTFKVLSIGFLVLILLIPAFMVKDLMRERKYRRDDAVREISDKWGEKQTVAGPVLTIPYKHFFKNSEGKTRFSIKNIHLLPREMAIEGSIKPQIRYRGIYEAVLYNTEISMHGTFDLSRYKELNVRAENILWERAFLSLGISDMRGIKEQISASVNGRPLNVTPGIDTKDVLDSGVSAKLKGNTGETTLPFQIQLNLNGSQQLEFLPVGEETRLKLTSSWPSPSFSGSFLPTDRKISDAGFEASWKVLHLNRNYPQQWSGEKHKIYDSAFGVKLFVATDIYQKSMRTAKYALMFIVFTFSAFFFSEVMNKKRLHPIQYLLIGFSLIIFYSLLISLSEHINFNLAYFLSSISIILLISGYTKSILHSNRLALTVFGLLVMLYLYLFMVLQLEDYALLMGSVGLFIVLSSIMYMTRKIDWYHLNFEDNDAS